MKNLFHTIDKTLFQKGNILLFFFLLSAILSQFNSAIFFIDILGQLSFQILVGGIILFFILLFLKRLWASILTILFCIVLSFQILLPCGQCNAFAKDDLKKNTAIRLMTFNVNYSNKFEYFDSFVELILEEKPDVIQFLESTELFQDKLKSLDSIYPYNVGLYQPITFWGSIVLSKYPLHNIEVSENHVVKANLLAKENEFRIIATHILPGGTQNHYNSALAQMEFLEKEFSQPHQNVILMGDLNMTAYSKRFINFLKATHLYTYTSLKRHTFTWPAFLPYFLCIQIDHVLFSDNIRMINKKISKSFGSDHRPLIVDLISVE